MESELIEVAKLASIGAKRRVIKDKMMPPPSEVSSAMMAVVSVEEKEEAWVAALYEVLFILYGVTVTAAVHEECMSAPKMKRYASH